MLTPTRSRYSDDEKARALVLCALHAPDYTAASAACDDDGLGEIPASTLRAWHQVGRGVHPAVLQLSQPYARATADGYTSVASKAVGVLDRALDRVSAAFDLADETNTPIPVAVALDMAERAMRIAAAATDRAQLLGGKPTQINETRATLLSLMLPLRADDDGDPDTDPA